MRSETKGQLIQLYKDGFPEDGERFVHLFFERVLDDSAVEYDTIDGKITSAVHMVTKRMKYFGDTIFLPYLVAVSTLTPYRGERRIEPVMRRALTSLQNVPFVALSPFSHQYYEKYGFVTVDTEYSIDSIACIGGTLRETDDISLLLNIYKRYMERYDIGIVRDEASMALRLDLMHADDGKAYIIENDKDIKGYVMAFGDKIDELVLLDDSILDIEYRRPRSNVMMRIVDIVSALEMMHFCSDVNYETQLVVHDCFLVDAVIYIDIVSGKVSAEYRKNVLDSISTIDITIEDLTLYVLGRIDVAGLPNSRSGAISMIDKY